MIKMHDLLPGMFKMSANTLQDVAKMPISSTLLYIQPVRAYAHIASQAQFDRAVLDVNAIR